MASEIIECEEFQPLTLRVSSLMENGELKIDERIASKGYLMPTMSGGQIVFRTTKYVGTIPITKNISIRVKPRAPIANLSYMLVKSGEVPTAIAGFSRGYMPRFVSASNAEKIYGRSLVEGAKVIAKRGFMKEYVKNPNSQWRGRFMASETIRRHASKGIRYRHEFDHSTLSPTVVENIALKEALKKVRAWFAANDRKNPIIAETDTLLHDLWAVGDWPGPRSDLVAELARKVRSVPPQLAHYRDPLWVAFLILQSFLPEVSFDGYVRLDSLIIDVSAVFESYIRKEITERLWRQGYAVEDGNKRPAPFFADVGGYTVHPDMIIKKDGQKVAILDAKYKIDPKEQDRYEVLSFMDTMDVKIGGFVCPSSGAETSRYLGSTATGKKMFSLRYDLSAVDPDAEADKFATNIIRMVDGRHDFL